MKYLWIVATVASLVGANACHAQDGVDKARTAAFDGQMFGSPLSQKTYACFVRRYDANHLARHPKQKVSAMKLLVTAEDVPEDKTINYSFRLGFKYRHRAGNFDSSGYCNHIVAENTGGEIRLGCSIDCEGGGIEVAMKDDRRRVGQFSKAGIELAACGNTMKAQNVALEDLLPGFIAADRGGVVRIAELQSQGYLYLRP
ncbi:DsrE family protein [Bradyrhizobium sp. AZCC 1721]|uniref:DsrE family protein n=1 Tax=Bradyrhizobium sp. AZCC 1721 TaxID=3117016 RepID=UPI002FEFD1B3